MERAGPGRIRVGTCGWTFPEWRGTFYPDSLAARRWFPYYADHFEAVEVNSTFYHLPAASTVAAWHRQAPPGFVYALKATQTMTHERSPDWEETLPIFLERARLLGDHLGPILFQFPPGLHLHLDWLRALVERLPAGFDHVLEFRHASWYVEEVRELLARRGVGLCLHDMHGSATPPWLTSPVAYVRLHGPTAVKYTGRYDIERLRRWAVRLRDFARSCRDVYLFFNNTREAAATADARLLRELLGQGQPA